MTRPRPRLEAIADTTTNRARTPEHAPPQDPMRLFKSIVDRNAYLTAELALVRRNVAGQLRWGTSRRVLFPSPEEVRAEMNKREGESV